MDRDGNEIVMGATAGRVNVTPATEGYRGATAHTNNTGEMTALLEAVRGEVRRAATGPTEFKVDSLYAINVATGRWAVKRGRRNAELARRLYEAYEDLRRRRPRGHVWITHVRAHTKVRGNEVADGLAKKAAADAGFRGSGRDVLATALELYRAYGGGQNLRRPPLLGQNLGVG